jgi:hypothetical protein
MHITARRKTRQGRARCDACRQGREGQAVQGRQAGQERRALQGRLEGKRAGIAGQTGRAVQAGWAGQGRAVRQAFIAGMSGIQCRNAGRQTGQRMKIAVFWVVAPCSLVESSTRLHGATTQKTAIFILTAVRTSNPTGQRMLKKPTSKVGTRRQNSAIFLTCVSPFSLLDGRRIRID